MDGIELDALLTEAAGGEPAEPATVDNSETPEQSAQEQPVQEPQPEQPEQEPAPEQPVQEQPKPKSNPMKEVRDKLNAEQKSREKIESAIQRFTNGDYDFKLKDFRDENGKIDYDALTKAMDDKDIARKAESRGLTPEVQAEIERIEQEKIELQKERLKVSMDRAISNLQVDMNLDRTAINQFFADSLAIKRNPYQWLAQGGSLEDLYYLIYREKITKATVDKAVADAKAEWEQLNSKTPPTSNPAKPAASTGGDNTLSLDQLLTEAVNKK